MIKRPVLELDGALLVGFSSETYGEALRPGPAEAIKK
jgi:arsenate reductase-like glutaredoxin family protein